MDQVQFKVGTKDELDEFVQLWNLVWPNHLQDAEDRRRDLEVLPVEQRAQFWLAKYEETSVGFAEISNGVGSYHPQRFELEIGVVPEYRGRGIGQALWELTLREVEFRNPMSILVRCRKDDEPSVMFAEHRGFSIIKEDFESFLDLTRLDLSRIDEIVRPAELHGIEIRPASELDSPDFRRAWHELFLIVRQDTPRSAPPTHLPFEQFSALVLDDPSLLWEGSMIAMAGTHPIGFSGLFKHIREGELDQWLTAVLAAYRGQGIAKALKAAGLRWALANGYHRIRTDNDSRNAPMLAINDSLGFERLPSIVTLVKLFD